jgi:uncharacterized protein (DUF1697 family)
MSFMAALVRGINVGGKSVKMDRLAASFEALGFTNVSTYIQSGNVVFKGRVSGTGTVAARIAARIRRDFGFDVAVLLRSATELAGISEHNPLAKSEGLDPAWLHVTFLAEKAPASAAEILAPLAGPGERVHVMGREVYLYCPGGYGNTKLSNGAIEKKLGLFATTRNWKTVGILCEMTGGTVVR